jgi:hypothetical protein
MDSSTDYCELESACVSIGRWKNGLRSGQEHETDEVERKNIADCQTRAAPKPERVGQFICAHRRGAGRTWNWFSFHDFDPCLVTSARPRFGIRMNVFLSRKAEITLRRGHDVAFRSFRTVKSLRCVRLCGLEHAV